MKHNEKTHPRLGFQVSLNAIIWHANAMKHLKYKPSNQQV